MKMILMLKLIMKNSALAVSTYFLPRNLAVILRGRLSPATTQPVRIPRHAAQSAEGAPQSLL